MPPAAADLRPAVPRLAAADQGAADRGRSLPGRHADHARRRRVHHQRRRARRGQPVAPQPRRRLRQRDGSRRPPHAQLPHHSRARQLDRAQHQKKDTLSVRIDQSGKFSAMTLLRAMDPKYSLERRADPRVLRHDDREGRRRPQRRQDRRQDRRRRHRLSGRAATRPARSSSRAARRSPRTSPR